jgi:DMSO/TMAO reductase YedYZ molybdopterin-dependent catalytic subunit
LNTSWSAKQLSLQKVGLLVAFLVLLLLAAAGCTAAPSSDLVSGTSQETNEAARTAAETLTPSPEASPTACVLPPLVVPAMPTMIPGYTEVDPATGLHMTGTVQNIDIASYHLEVTGSVDHPLKLSYDDLRCLPKIEKHLTLTCPGFFQDEATWAGVPLNAVLNLAGVQSGALHMKLISADGYSVSLPIDTGSSDENFLAFEMDGKPLPRLHGFPLRAVFPGLTGGNWVKWLVKIDIY